jgi:hypothetical protein
MAQVVDALLDHAAARGAQFPFWRRGWTQNVLRSSNSADS